MASHDQDERDHARRPSSYVQKDRHDERDPRFLDSRDYGRSRLALRSPQDSDLSVEEIRRNFLPPTGREVRRARSAEHGCYGDDDDDHRRRDQDDFDDPVSSRRSRRYADDYDDDSRYGRGREGGGGGDDYGYERSPHSGGYRDSSHRRGGSKIGSESDLGDSDEELKQERKMRGKQILTTGFATVATIHAAHGVYQSMKKRTARQRAVKEGRLSAADAKTMKSKAMIKDAGSVGIAALGIKGAFEEMKKAKELTHECKNFKQERAKRHEKREMKRKKSNQPDDSKPRQASSRPARPPVRYDDRFDRDDHGP